MSGVAVVADLFCGAGGSSTGALRALNALGLEMHLVAVNHWSVAIETHSRNHPHARHLCVDVYTAKPREAVPGGTLDLLMASPTCTYHSRARGGRPISWDQRYGRMTPTQVLRWLTDLDVRCLLVENVPEFVDWCPVGRVSGKPIREKRGMYFRAWVRRIRRLGYKTEWRILNAADYGDVTTRRRFFLIARKDGRAIAWPTPTHSPAGNSDLLGAGQTRWRAAREIIDWTLPSRSVFGRKRPLSPKTLARIYAGAVRFGWPNPFLVILRRHMDASPLGAPLPTVCAGGNHGAHALVTPYSRTSRARSADEPLSTQTTRDRFGLVVPVTHHDESVRVRSVEQPLTGARRDILFRMLQPHELAAAMGFYGYEFCGTKEEVTRQIGNAVPVHTACALVKAIFA